MKNTSKLMKSIIRLTITLLVLSVFGKELNAQNNTKVNADTALLNPSIDIEDLLPPLDSLYVIALKTILYKDWSNRKQMQRIGTSSM